ncbi:Phospho-N-acetylmuramoyl-pentapeptide-transferase [Caloramator mitchellensis]|uniref:Phospho-N-acetylmuramoyl-pentapeptide-transferase n=1 Tax=Caloramator mitchellensis TaxID=908809 RepID=A0A0R3JSY2_CALMK|nr:phospho-N-acetylmuramoyl-pentapeptide-transferase [Caloramator mitchellensis]KRQ86587.1 Phospho-N-acetylmuramoyl-pentapeptide-transferase [Caloramator mitchellensis]
MQITIYSTIVSFLVALLLGPIVIPALRKFKFGQSIRDEGPRTHFAKAGTPTMGGLIFIISLLLTSLVVSQRITGALFIALLTTVGFGFIGLLDDSIKIIKKRNLGLRAYQKIIGQLTFAIILTIYAYKNPLIGSGVHVPFTNIIFDLGIWYIPFMIFVIVGTTNAVNLTDGLDGLASSVTLIVSVFFAVVTYGLGKTDLSIFCGALAGGLLGFLKFNSYPAEVFMGDTGSLALGGAISALAVLLKMPFIIVIVGGIYVIETLSVIIQVISFKMTGRRVFKMAPLHHHFEQKGNHETKIVAWFVIITAVLCLIGFLSISL